MPMFFVLFVPLCGYNLDLNYLWKSVQSVA